MEFLQEIDGRLLLWLREFCGNPFLDRVMPLVSALGNGGFLWLFLGAVFLLLGIRRRIWLKRGLELFLALGANAVVCNLILKPLFHRARPYAVLEYDILIPALSDASFPSGHTSAAFAAAAVIYAMHCKWGLLVYGLAVLMGFSRLYLGVHFPTDVLAGATIGICVAKAVIHILNQRGIFCRWE